MLNWEFEIYWDIFYLATRIDFQMNTHCVIHTIQNKQQNLLHEWEFINKKAQKFSAKPLV